MLLFDKFWMMISIIESFVFQVNFHWFYYFQFKPRSCENAWTKRSNRFRFQRSSDWWFPSVTQDPKWARLGRKNLILVRWLSGDHFFGSEIQNIILESLLLVQAKFIASKLQSHRQVFETHKIKIVYCLVKNQSDGKLM